VIERYFGDDRPVTDADGWLPTGDLARIDADGHLVVTGRAQGSDQVRRRVDQPRRDRGAVGALPEVALVAVIDVPTVNGANGPSSWSRRADGGDRGRRPPGAAPRQRALVVDPGRRRAGAADAAVADRQIDKMALRRLHGAGA
jgi:fatty-acyl-CoA synthase